MDWSKLNKRKTLVFCTQAPSSQPPDGLDDAGQLLLGKDCHAVVDTLDELKVTDGSLALKDDEALAPVAHDGRCGRDC